MMLAPVRNFIVAEDGMDGGMDEHAPRQLKLLAIALPRVVAGGSIFGNWLEMRGNAVELV